MTSSHATLDATGSEVVSSIFSKTASGRGTRQQETIPTSRVLTPGYPLFRITPGTAAGYALGGGEHGAAPGNQSPESLERTSSRITGAFRAELRAAGWVRNIYGRSDPAGVLREVPLGMVQRRGCSGSRSWKTPTRKSMLRCAGTIWHLALGTVLGPGDSRGLSGYSGPEAGEGPDPGAGDLTWAEPMLLAALDEAWTEQGDQAWLGNASPVTKVTREALRNTLLRYVRWEVQVNERLVTGERRTRRERLRTAVYDHELADHWPDFGAEFGIRLDLSWQGGSSRRSVEPTRRLRRGTSRRWATRAANGPRREAAKGRPGMTTSCCRFRSMPTPLPSSCRHQSGPDRVPLPAAAGDAFTCSIS